MKIVNVILREMVTIGLIICGISVMANSARSDDMYAMVNPSHMETLSVDSFEDFQSLDFSAYDHCKVNYPNVRIIRNDIHFMLHMTIRGKMSPNTFVHEYQKIMGVAAMTENMYKVLAICHIFIAS